MYRVEIFNMYNKAFVDAFSLGDDAVIKEDYINPVKFDITGPAGLSCDIRNTLQIMKDNTRLFCGYIVDVERTKTTTIITVAPLCLQHHQPLNRSKHSSSNAIYDT